MGGYRLTGNLMGKECPAGHAAGATAAGARHQTRREKGIQADSNWLRSKFTCRFQDQFARDDQSDTEPFANWI